MSIIYLQKKVLTSVRIRSSDDNYYYACTCKKDPTKIDKLYRPKKYLIGIFFMSSGYNNYDYRKKHKNRWNHYKVSIMNNIVPTEVFILLCTEKKLKPKF